MRSPEHAGTLILIAIFLLLKIGTVVAIYKANPHLASYRATLEATHHSARH